LERKQEVKKSRKSVKKKQEENIERKEMEYELKKVLHKQTVWKMKR
jgi:hypothetical protein